MPVFLAHPDNRLLTNGSPLKGESLSKTRCKYIPVRSCSASCLTRSWTGIPPSRAALLGRRPDSHGTPGIVMGPNAGFVTSGVMFTFGSRRWQDGSSLEAGSAFRDRVRQDKVRPRSGREGGLGQAEHQPAGTYLWRVSKGTTRLQALRSVMASCTSASAPPAAAAASGGFVG
jgi:hypothetical protein